MYFPTIHVMWNPCGWEWAGETKWNTKQKLLQIRLEHIPVNTLIKI